MIGAYFDESGTDADIMCVAAMLFTVESAEAFENEWSRELDKAGIDYFHAREFFPGVGQFADMDQEERDLFGRKLISLSRRTAIGGQSVVLSQSEFKTKAPIWWKRALGSPYSGGLAQCIASVARWVSENRPDELIAYFFEAGSEWEGEARIRMELTCKDPVQRQAILHHSDTFINKGVDGARPCEAADFFAWQIRKHTVEAGRVMRKDFAALMDGQEEDYQLYHLSGRNLAEFFAAAKPPPGFS